MGNKKKKPKREYTPYIIEITDWTVPYSFSLNRSKNIDWGPYSEHVSLEIQGCFIYPQKYIDNKVSMIFFGDRRDMEMLNHPEKYDDVEPLCVGTLSIRGEERHYLGSLPMDALGIVIQALTAKVYNYVIFYGYTPRYRKAEIFNVHFEKEFDEEEWY